MIVRPKPIRANVDYIAGVVCKNLEIDPNVLSSRTRKREIVTARYVIWNVMMSLLVEEYTLEFLSKCLGGNHDHCTVIHSKLVIGNLIETDAKFREMYENTLKECSGNMIHHKKIRVELEKIFAMDSIEMARAKVAEIINEFVL